VTCKNVWTSREGVEYVWFNNVETKPGIGYPKEWENQEKWKGGWIRKPNGKIEPRQGARWRILANIFANPHLPEIDDYYEPFTFDYEHLHTAPESQAMPTARPRPLVSGERMEKVERYYTFDKSGPMADTDERQAGDEIEVTEEMIRAGLEQLYLWEQGRASAEVTRSVVEAIFLAMFRLHHPMLSSVE
jgi:nitrate reductase beta subunit